MRCIAHIGVFRALERYGCLRCVKEVIGLSGGALFALMFALGYKVAEIEKLALELDFQALAHIEPETLLDFPQTLGCNSGQAMQTLVASILKQKGLAPEATFADIAAAGKFVVGFRCYATEVQSARSLEFSVAKTPTLPLTTALRATTALPFLYAPVQDPAAPHILWADGGVLHNVPFAFLAEHEKNDTWAVQFLSQKPAVLPTDKISDPLDYFQYIYTAAFEIKNRWLYDKYSSQILQISIPTKTALHFNLTKEDRQTLMTHAESTALSFLHKTGNLLPRRRYSAA
jgi:predicted acylesterase/phospholipase RssA